MSCAEEQVVVARGSLAKPTIERITLPPAGSEPAVINLPPQQVSSRVLPFDFSVHVADHSLAKAAWLASAIPLLLGSCCASSSTAITSSILTLRRCLMKQPTASFRQHVYHTCLILCN